MYQCKHSQNVIKDQIKLQINVGISKVRRSRTNLHSSRSWYWHCQRGRGTEIRRRRLAPGDKNTSWTSSDADAGGEAGLLRTSSRSAWALAGGSSLRPAVALNTTGVLFHSTGGTVFFATRSNCRTVCPAWGQKRQRSSNTRLSANVTRDDDDSRSQGRRRTQTDRASATGTSRCPTRAIRLSPNTRQEKTVCCGFI